MEVLTLMLFEAMCHNAVMSRRMHHQLLAVLLGPNVKSVWIPDVPGLVIRQLSYKEQSRVPEYYDITPSFKGNVIHVDVAKGNFCKKVGRRYEFRRKKGTWQSEVVSELESVSMGGSRCDGCVIGSGATYSVPRQRTDSSHTSNLRLTGSGRKISCSKDADDILCNVGLTLKFTNTASTSLIILQPHGEYEFWHGGISLVLSDEMWPFNVENFKPDLGGILQKRWRSYGSLYLEEKRDRYWSAILISEPIEFPLNQVDLAQ